MCVEQNEELRASQVYTAQALSRGCGYFSHRTAKRESNITSETVFKDSKRLGILASWSVRNFHQS